VLNNVKKSFEKVYDYFTLVARAFAGIVRPPFYFAETLRQMENIGVQSLPIVLLTSTFVGMILAYQSGFAMAIFGAKMYIGTLISLSLVRELGPVLAAIVVAGRVGAGTAAELGSMLVTEQIDAMRAMATDPIKKLVSTKLLAGMIMIPLLVIIADLMGILGGGFIASTSFGLAPTFYKKTVIQALVVEDLVMTLVKALFFSVLIVTIGCYSGLHVEGGTTGVGKATTKAVVLSIIFILITDYFLTVVLLKLLPGLAF
jgi:phospholipid/cholesterol/gamma-HCH transport system permease protein